MQYLHFTDTVLNVPDSKREINKFLHTLLYLKGIHIVYKVRCFFSEEHYGIIKQNKTEDFFHVHPRVKNESETTLQMYVCPHARANITELTFSSEK